MTETFCERHGGTKLQDEAFCDVKEIKVVNRHHGPAEPGVKRFYVGRPSPLGNPFVVGTHGDRKECIKRFERYFYDRINTPCDVGEEFAKIVEHMMAHCYVELECFCAPQSCHAEIIREAIFDDDWLWK